jgi:hypothetical protein
MGLTLVNPTLEVNGAQVFTEIVVADCPHVLASERIFFLDAEKVAVLFQ